MRRHRPLIPTALLAALALSIAQPPAAQAQSAQERPQTPRRAEPAEPEGQGTPPARQKAPDQKEKGKAAAKERPGIPVQQPRTPAERDKALGDLYAHLATAADDTAAKTVAAAIERLWGASGSDTVSVLMHRAAEAQQAKQNGQSLKFLDRVVAIAPDYGEGWHRRAVVLYSMGDIQRALGDLRRVLALDPNHFKALEGMGHMLREIGEPRGALAVFRRLQEVHPFADGLDRILPELAREVEGDRL
jgi:tetratricopeptide (TPR) repeat protein